MLVPLSPGASEGGNMRGFATKLLAFTVVMAASIGVVPAAADTPATHCNFVFDVILDPGLSMEPSTGVYFSDGVGTLDCHGPVNGRQPTGVGTLGDKGSYGTVDPDSCPSGGETTGLDHLTVPTARGLEEINSEYTSTYGKLSNQNGVFGGEFTGTRFTGTFRITVLKGDCVTSPITKVRVTGEGVLKD